MANKTKEKTAKSLPHSTDAEMAVLGCMMIDKECAVNGLDILDSDCFYHEKHKSIFIGMQNLKKLKREIDVLTVSNVLAENDMLEEIGGNYYVTELVERIPSSANFETYVDILLDKSKRNDFIKQVNQASENAWDEMISTDELIAEHESKIFSINANNVKSAGQSLGNILPSVIERLETVTQTRGAMTGIPTPFETLNDYTCGFQNNDFLILAARPSVGKTTLALQFVKYAAQLNIPVGFLSFEMAPIELSQKLLIMEANVNAHAARAGLLGDEAWKDLVSASSIIADLPIYIEKCSGMTIEQVRAVARRMKRDYDVQFLLLDYMGLVRTKKDYQTDNQRISYISGHCKEIPQELGIPFLGLSQLSRESKKQGRPPRLDDLRDSGSLEQDGDLIMFLHRPHAESYQANNAESRQAYLDVAKQRNGMTGEVQLEFDMQAIKFIERPKDIPVGHYKDQF